MTSEKTIKRSDEKPIVHFDGQALFYDYGDNPEWPVADVFAVDHPILGMQRVRTSIVLKVNDDGSFETLNTRYVPVEDDDEEA